MNGTACTIRVRINRNHRLKKPCLLRHICIRTLFTDFRVIYIYITYNCYINSTIYLTRIRIYMAFRILYVLQVKYSTSDESETFSYPLVDVLNMVFLMAFTCTVAGKAVSNSSFRGYIMCTVFQLCGSLETCP